MSLHQPESGVFAEGTHRQNVGGLGGSRGESGKPILMKSVQTVYSGLGRNRLSLEEIEIYLSEFS